MKNMGLCLFICENKKIEIQTLSRSTAFGIASMWTASCWTRWTAAWSRVGVSIWKSQDQFFKQRGSKFRTSSVFNWWKCIRLLLYGLDFKWHLRHSTNVEYFDHHVKIVPSGPNLRHCSYAEYFDHHLGNAHSKCLSKAPFCMFLQDFDAKMMQKWCKKSIFLPYPLTLVDTKTQV